MANKYSEKYMSWSDSWLCNAALGFLPLDFDSFSF